MHLTLMFKAGIEESFGNQKHHEIDLPSESGEITITDLFDFMRDKMLQGDPSKFFDEDDNCVRPGILVLINGVDWEISGRMESVLKEKDSVLFISTLHGG